MHTLRLAHILLCIQYAHAAIVGSRHATLVQVGPYRGVSCHCVEEAAALFDVCSAGLTLMITDVKSVHLSSGPWIGGEPVILGSPGP